MQNTEIREKPLVSFIITYYDLPVDMLKECIGSIQALSLSEAEREIILVDDGSDHCPLEELKESINDIVYIRQKNGGLSIARNTGIEMSKGKYIQFVDGDDMLLRTPYEHCLDIIRYDKDADMVLFESDSKVVSQAIFQDKQPESGTSYMHNNNLHATAWGYIFKRSLLGDLRFCPGILHEDEDFTPRLMLRAEKVISTNAKAYFYRKRDESIVNNKDMSHKLRRLDDMESVIFHLADMADRIPHNERVALQRRVHQLTMDYIYNIIILTRSRHQLDERLENLRKRNLFPLSKNDYTGKYKMFRLLTTNGLTRKLLLRVLPLINGK